MNWQLLATWHSVIYALFYSWPVCLLSSVLTSKKHMHFQQLMATHWMYLSSLDGILRYIVSLCFHYIAASIISLKWVICLLRLLLVQQRVIFLCCYININIIILLQLLEYWAAARKVASEISQCWGISFLLPFLLWSC